MLARLKGILEPQMTNEVEVLVSIDNGEMSIGGKRNKLLKESKGEYVCFIDDDDIVSDDYIPQILAGCDTGVDCISFRTIYKLNDGIPNTVYNSLQITEWWDCADPKTPGAKIYFRCPQHLTPVKREFALNTLFPETNMGEDHAYSQKLTPQLKTEYVIPKPLYFYMCGGVKS